DGDREIYIGSADWMGRSLDRRVETAVPILDPLLAQTIYGEILAVMFADNLKSRQLETDGRYWRVRPSAAALPVDSQHVFLTKSQAG
ncbi:MAG: RNA degradosome polyphosphate kinase, partial [Candidatus Baltobacteraceae bacterium]